MSIIREETPEDAADIRRVNERAFGQPNEADLVDALRRRGAVTLSLVATEDSRIVGHILFSPVTIESAGAGSPAIALGPMAVLPEYQNRGIGSQLVEAGLKMCRDAGHKLVIVLGHPNFYPRFGFIPAKSLGITCPFDVPDEVFMVKVLVESSSIVPSGAVKYQPEFMEV
ncbi:MAG: N-acetyltransferase [Chloroflexi bacterium]|nr:N-acetyltransferase [Chloroflexota bacterium]MDA1219211.1 N-acetyltransferase [Chloroflexota bacterium]